MKFPMVQKNRKPSCGFRLLKRRLCGRRKQHASLWIEKKNRGEKTAAEHTNLQNDC